MKRSSKKFLAVVLAAGSLATAGQVQATPGKLDNLNFITVACKLQLQGDFVDDGSLRNYANPTIARLGTKELLAALANDKYAQTNYPANYFPAGAKLAFTQDGTFLVVSRNNELLADVSDLMHFSTGTNDIVSGRVDNSTGLASPNRKNLVLVTLNFDDTSITNGSNLRFSIQGLDQIKTRDTKPGGGGNYNENTTHQISNAVGEGQSGDTPFIITGTIHGNGKARLTLPPPG
jgi:hypothetical protein